MNSSGQFNASAFAALAALGSDNEGPRLHAQRAVRFTVELSPEGEVLRVVTHPKPTPDNPPYLALCPREAKARSGGIVPLLLTDNAMYVLGLNKPGGKKANGLQKREAYLALLQQGQHLPILQAALHGAQQLTPDLFPDVTAEDLITFRVGGVNPHEQTDVQALWVSLALPQDRESGQCSVTGTQATLARNSPLVTGIPGGKANLTIQSKNASAFVAYGLDDLGMSQETIEAVQRALNSLSRDPLHAWRIKGLDFITLHFVEGPGLDPWGSLTEPTNAEISAALNAQTISESDTRLHLIKLQGSAARLMLLDYRVLSLTEASCHTATYLRRTEGLELWKAESVMQDAGGKPIASLIHQLHALIFTAAPPSREWTRHLLSRFNQNLSLNRTETQLFKLIFSEATMQDPQHLPDDQYQAYQLGQFLATCDDLHSQANPTAQQHVGDRYLRSFPSATERGFASVSELLTSVISGLKPRKPGLALHLTRRLSAATSELKLPLPKRLNMDQHAAFILGYLQEKDRQFTEMIERKAQKEQQSA